MAHGPRPISHRLIRLARDLRLSAALLVIWLIPPAAAVAKGPIPEPETAGRASGDDTDHRDAASRAYIIHLPGIAGPMRFDSRFGEGLVIGQAGSEVEIFDWVNNRRGLLALFDVEENRRQARRLAERIIALKAKDPARPLVITAHSGGTAVVAWALEMLAEGTEARRHEGTNGAGPETTVRVETTHGSATNREREGAVSESASGQRVEARGSPKATPTGSSESRGPSMPAREPLVDGVLFIASGLSSDYDLSPTLRQVRGRLFHLSSKHDNLILAAGTAVFGTLDRKNGLAAGKTGFYLPAGVAPESYERFVEVPYDRAWAEYGHYGDHEGMMTTSFAAKVAADLVRASLGVSVELPTTRPARPAPVKPTTGEVGANPQGAPEAAGRE